MSAIERRNAILSGLDPHEADALRSAAENVGLGRGEVIADAGAPAPHVYFPLEGVVSLVGTTIGGNTVELAVVGNEGVASVSALLGKNWLPFRVVTQIPGRALRVPTQLVSTLMAECGELHARLLDYTHYLIAQMAQSAICNRFHNARQRLARWLLMTADRADSKELAITHEFISYMVGGPRSAVTEAAADLRDAGAIDYRRGLIVIRDPAILRQRSCECYAILENNTRTDGGENTGTG
jgi:CRP-like cAMP-binding protein